MNNLPQPYPYTCPGITRQGGVALIVTLVFLVMMTSIGVTMLTSTRMGQDMAANFQESNRAFQTAETGVVVSLDDDSWNTNISTPSTGEGTTGLGYYEFERDFKDFFPLKRRKSQIYSAIHFHRAQFAIESKAEVKTAEDADLIAKATVNEGVYLIVPKM